MSMKLAKWRGRVPMQNEHEKRKNRGGGGGPGASVYAECREPQPGTDPRLSQIERTDRFRGVWAGREIRLGRVCAATAELRRVEQAGPGRSARLFGKSDGDERGADDAIDTGVSRQRGGEGCAVPTALLQRVVHSRGHHAAGGSGPGARAVEGAGDAPPLSLATRAVWERNVAAR